jgi:sulfoxide reductase catalytic subunit YedY
MKKIDPSEITPEHLYLSRREFIKGLGIISASAAVLAACNGKLPEEYAKEVGAATPTTGAPPVPPGSTADELGDPLNSYEDITSYNNYYEFTTDKLEVAELAKDFITSPWTVRVGGLVKNPKTYSLDDLFNFEAEERIYRLRCVEGWSMVIPWMGFPLRKLLNEVEPKSKANYVRFESVKDPFQMPGIEKYPWYNWPYVEGLRLDEAMNDLAILATGIYGKDLLPQNGAPVRLAVPWKYGFKSIKSIVKIDLVEDMPKSLWMTAAPREYGFYANVNPEVNHPRWSQASERRIGELGRRDTLMFNGYEEEVAYLYEGMDLRKHF